MGRIQAFGGSIEIQNVPPKPRHYPKSLRASPAMAAGITERLWPLEDIVAGIDAMAPPPTRRGPYRKRAA